jgi:MFS family permease
MILSVIIFALGSGISGGANGPIMLLAGRIVQGTGGAGIGLLTHIIISDLVPVRERSKFMAIIFSSFAVGTALGPFIGGTVVQRVSWRWVFYINLPISGIAVLLLYLFLQVQSIKPQSSRGILMRVDFIGIFLLMTSVTALLLGVSFGGSRFPWSSWRVIVPLALGSLGLFLFYAYEASGLCLDPILPFRILVSNRTTTIALILSFCHFLFSYWMIYILPVYFQGVLLLSPEKSGMLLLPTVLVIVPLSVISGVILTRSGRYKPMHIIATGLITLGSGFFILLDSESSVFECMVCQCIMASGVGMLMSTLVPAVQAGLPEADVSVATATWGFFCASGGIWGVAIPGAILDSQFQRYLRNRIHNLDVVRTLEKGSAYLHILDIYFRDILPDLYEDLIGIYVDSLWVIWAVCTVISGLSFLLCLLEKEIPLWIKN